MSNSKTKVGRNSSNLHIFSKSPKCLIFIIENQIVWMMKVQPVILLCVNLKTFTKNVVIM